MGQVIETERLRLRRFCLADADGLYAYAKNELVGPEAGWLPHRDIRESQKLLENWSVNPEIFALEEKASGQLIGSVGLHQRFDRAVPTRELGYVLAFEKWGMGYMSEAVSVMIDYAFLKFGAEIVVASHHQHNMRSKRVIEKAGFHFEGVKRLDRRHPLTKEILDTWIYSLTKEEWGKRKCIK